VSDPVRIVYSGRMRPAPDLRDAVVLSEWDVLPADLHPLLAAAEALVVLDPLSFPFEHMRSTDGDIPIAVALPGEDPAGTEELLGSVCLDHLGPWDAVAAGDATWESLRQLRRWPETLRCGADPDPRLLLGRLMGVTRGTKRRWLHLHGRVRRYLTALGRAPVVLDLGAVVAGWLGDVETIAVVTDEIEERLAAAVPGTRTIGWDGRRLDLEVGAADLVVAPAVVDARRPGTVPPEEWWRVTRPGGRVVVEIEADPDIAGSGPFAVRDAVIDAANRPVGVEAATSVLLPGESVRRFGVAAFAEVAA